MSKADAPPITLVNHRRVAEWWDVLPKTIRRWVDAGKFPAPHSETGSYLLFDRAVIEHRLRTGLWPAGTKFHGAGQAVGVPNSKDVT